LLGKVGKGGMGNVFKARQISMDRIVALKVLTTSLAKDKKFVERFHREAKAAAKLSHMNIIQSIDVDEEDGYHYFAMEYVQGPTVDDLLQKTPILKEDFCLDIIVQIARAIQAAEKLGIVHFDIKPSNIMITRDRVAKLADFGLARRVDESATRAKQTLVFGTPEYMSPEQALGKPDVDSRSDIYSLGITFYQMVTGRLPFEGKTPRETVDLRLTTAPVPPKQLNPSLSEATCQIMDKMLKRDRTHRYQTAAELIEDIEFVASQRSNSGEAQAAGVMQIDIPPEELGAVEQFRYMPRRRKKVAGPLFGLVCLAAFAGGVLYLVKHPELVEKIKKQYGIQIGAQPAQPQKPLEPKIIIKTPSGNTQPFVPKNTSVVKPTGHVPVKKKGRSHPKAKQSYREIMDMRRHRLMQNDFRGLLKLYDMFPDNYKFAQEWKELESLREKDLKAAQQKLKTQDAAIAMLIASGKSDKALDQMDKMKERFPDELLAEIEFEKKYKQIKEHIGKQARKQSAQKVAVLSEYFDAAGSAYTMALQGQYTAAGKKLDELMIEPKFGMVAEVIRTDQASIGLLKDYMTSILAGGKALKGKPFKVGGIGKNLVSIQGGTVTLEIAGKQTTTKLSDLKPKELNDLAKAGGFLKSHNQGELHLRCAIFYYFSRDMGNAVEQLLKAQEEGADISKYETWMKK